jgi:hypothetical protein
MPRTVGHALCRRATLRVLMRRILVIVAATLVVPLTAAAKKKKTQEDIDVPIVPIAVVKLNISTTVSGAQVFVDGKAVGSTPLAAPISGLALGKHKILLKRPGYADYRADVELKAGDNKLVSAEMRATAGFITVHSSALGGMAYIDGLPAGGLPVLEKDVAPGVHTVEVKAPGLETFTQQVSVKVGEVQSVEAALRPPGPAPSLAVVGEAAAERSLTANQPVEPGPASDETSVTKSSGGFFSNWWVWAGIGVIVVAAAAATTTYVVTRPPAFVHIYPASPETCTVNSPYGNSYGGIPACQ